MAIIFVSALSANTKTCVNEKIQNLSNDNTHCPPQSSWFVEVGTFSQWHELHIMKILPWSLITMCNTSIWWPNLARCKSFLTQAQFYAKSHSWWTESFAEIRHCMFCLLVLQYFYSMTSPSNQNSVDQQLLISSIWKWGGIYFLLGTGPSQPAILWFISTFSPRGRQIATAFIKVMKLNIVNDELPCYFFLFFQQCCFYINFTSSKPKNCL